VGDPRIAIIGAGPTGLGAAHRLEELGVTSWALFETSPEAGGLSSSVVDEKGFTWDLGGHVLFSHYRYFDALMERALGDAWVEHQREAWVWMRERWVPYPFQNNIWRLPPEDLAHCLDGMVDLATGAAPTDPPAHFGEWLERQFGPGLCDVFMFPYNRKVWAYPPDQMNVEWMGERVATIDLKRILRNIAFQRDEVSWGPNATFRFPLRGGTGAIWKSLGEQLPAERMRLGTTVERIELDARRLHLVGGEVVDYDHLISSMPLDILLDMSDAAPEVKSLSSQFTHSSSHIMGFGFEGTVPEDLKTKCWMYFPEDDAPPYRVTVFSNYSPHNVPEPGQQWSLMAEVSESSVKPVDMDKVAMETLESFRRCNFIGPEEQPVSVWHRRLEHGYPTPWLGRDAVLEPVQAYLSSRGVLSRGRFGTWKYEVSNQDHSVMQGVEAVERIINGGEEYTFHGDMRDWLDPQDLAVR